jgi:tetratricopeptide (TPR) repeat protein
MHFIQSRIHHHEQKFQQAIELIFKGIELARINNFSSSEFTLWNELGAIFLSKKEYEAAERCLYSAGEIAKLKKIEKPFVKTLLQLGLLHLTIGKIADAESYISKAEQLAKKHNDALKLIEALEMYSKFYSFQHKYNEAIVKLLEARSLTQKYEFHYLEANILYRLSEYYQIIGNKAKMQKCLIERFNIEQRLGEEIIHEVRR